MVGVLSSFWRALKRGDMAWGRAGMTLGTAGPQKGRGVEGEGRVQWGEGEGWHSCQQMSQMPPWGAVRRCPDSPS